MGIFDAALLASAIGLTVPILLASMGELVSERAGVLNVGLEGMILSGAFVAYFVAWKTGSTAVGLLGGIAGGAIFGLIMALLAVKFGADQIVSGVGINILAVGATSFAFNEIFGTLGQQTLDRIGAWSIPLLSDTGLGKALVGQDPITYFAFISVPLCWWLLYRTKWGLALRGAGEYPAAVDAAGISVYSVRWSAVIFAAAMSGLAGAYLTVVEVGIFRQEMSAGRGFLALTAVIFGRWRPGGVLLACLLFGAADALQLRLQIEGSLPNEVWTLILLIALVIAVLIVLQRAPVDSRRRALTICGLVAAAATALWISSPTISLPHQLWLALPFILALIALSSTKGKARMPAALTLPYTRE